ncbi:MAG: flagellar biosynthetic protein FliR [Thermodesulfovibrionales bacterium]
MNNIDFIARYIPNFLLITIRAGFILIMLPFFGSKTIPAAFKIGLILAIAAVLTPVIDFKIKEDEIPLLVIRELFIGITLGLVARTVFLAIETAGQIMSNTMGLSIATFFNPEIGQSTEVARLFSSILMLLFLSMDAHHDLIYIFARSYEWVPGGSFSVKSVFPEIINLTGSLFIIALKVSAPVVTVMVVTNILFGFLYRAAPQMNIFFVGYPVYIFVGLFVMLLSMPVFVNVSGNLLSSMREEMLRTIELMRR